MLQKKMELGFIVMTILALAYLAYGFYQDYSFKNNDISESYKKLIKEKEQEVLANMQKNFGFRFQVPLIVTDKFKGRLYGLTAYRDGQIEIYLNKKVMQESMEYMIDSVIAHEYAHALMFKLGYLHTGDDGHSDKWQQTCVLLGGVDCRQYVNTHEIIMSKMPFQ